ncbi:MAG: hypothetical protein PHH26_01885 [Candidatus Thermoplasmatota archaeon]|nr:hypothetical protein [Candidatus Thermoplasmatota archaeon]
MANRKSDELPISAIADELRGDQLKMRILEVMVKENRPMSAEEIAQKAGCSVYQVESILSGIPEN